MAKIKRRGKRRAEKENDEQDESLVNVNITKDPVEVVDKSSLRYPKFAPLTKETIEYFKNIEKILQDDNFDAEYDGLIEKAFEEIDGKELALSADYGTSRIMEQILSKASEFQLRVLFDRLRGSIAPLFVHQYASHVMQMLLMQCASKMAISEVSDNTTDDAEELMSIKDLIVEMCGEIDGYWGMLMADTYGSHLMRTVLNILSGRPLIGEQANTKSKSSRDFAVNHQLIVQNDLKNISSQRSVPEEFKDILNRIIESLLGSLTDSQLCQFAVNFVASPVLQILLQILPQTFVDQLANRLLMNIQDSGDSDEGLEAKRLAYVQKFMQDQVGSHLFERILQCVSVEMLQLIYLQFFKGRLCEYAKHPFANYVVQHILDCLKSAEQLEAVVNELFASSPTATSHLLFEGRSNVVLKALDACNRLGAGYSTVCDGIKQAFELKGSRDNQKVAIKFILALQPPSKEPPKYARFAHIVGSQIIQKLLLFPEVFHQFLIASLFAMPAEFITQMLTDPTASRAFEIFLTSPQIGHKVKRKIIGGMLTGRFAEMAQNKYACHIVDKCWAVAELKQKESIAEELLKAEQSLLPSVYGRLILRNCRIEQFKRRRSEWTEHEAGKIKKRKMFKDFLEGDNDKKQQHSSNDHVSEIDALFSSKPPSTKKHKSQ